MLFALELATCLYLMALSNCQSEIFSGEQRLQRRCKRDGAPCTAEAVEQSEAQQRIRNRAKRASVTVQQRQAYLQHRHDRLNTESTEEREVRLERKREGLLKMHFTFTSSHPSAKMHPTLLRRAQSCQKIALLLSLISDTSPITENHQQA